MESLSRLVGKSGDPESRDDLDVAIIGAGLAGIATAISLLKVDKKLKLKVYEKRSPLGEGRKYGGACRLEPNGLKAVEAIDNQLFQLAEINGTSIRETVLHDVDGTEISRMEEKHDNYTVHGKSTILIGWYELEQILLHQLPPDTVEYGRTFQTYSEDDCGVIIQLEEEPHKPVRAKYLVGCDGPWSRIRQQCVDDGTPLFDGTVRWMGRLAGDEVSTTPLEGSNWWVRPGQVFSTHPMHGCDVAWEGVVDEETLVKLGYHFDPHTQQVVALEGGDQQTSLAHKLREIFRDFPTPVHDMITNSHPDSIVEAPLFVRRPAQMPPAMGRGHAVLLGQAAHPLRNTGQEESQALEDAAELGAAVMMFGLSKEALRRFEQRRLPRWRHVIQVTMAQAASSHTAVGIRQSFLDYSTELYRQSFVPLRTPRKPRITAALRTTWAVAQVVLPLAVMVVVTPDMRRAAGGMLRRVGINTKKLAEAGEQVAGHAAGLVKEAGGMVGRKVADGAVSGTVQVVTPPATRVTLRVLRERIAKFLGAF